MSRSVSSTASKRAPHSYLCSTKLEDELRSRGCRLIAGCDEVGRGSLFGAVVAASVILSPDDPIPGLNDSKKLDHAERVRLAALIRERATAWAIASVDSPSIDRINIYEASRLAMKKAVEQLSPRPDFLLVDALALDLPIAQQALIKGDERSHSIAAASIIAKVYRDDMMCAWDKFYPEYGLASHKGYHAPEHIDAIRRLGPTPLHRMSFEPIRANAVWSHLPDNRQLEMFSAV